ncbi:hypothetical protein C8R46DRAFT_241440 [Mycena filopes]|nr:hypothetical protein C8R46DRAFT_241440 [Mycena filopes]
MQDGASDFVELDGATQVLVNAQLDLKRKVQQQADELILKDEALKTTKKELAELQVLYGTAQAYKDEMSKTLADRYLKILTSTNAIQSDRIALDQQTTALQERADAVDLRCSELEKRESVMNAALQSLHGQEADIRARGQTVDERSRELDERVLIANAHFREIKEQTTVLDGRAEQLRQQAERLQQRGEQLGQQEANMVAWTGEVEEHQRRAQAQHTALLEREQRLDVESGLLNNSMLQFAEKFQLKVEEHQVKAAALQAHIVNTTNKKEQLEAALKSRSEDYNILNQTLIHERNRAQAVIDSTTTKISQHIAKCAEMQEKLDAALTTNDEVRELRAKVADTANHSTTISRLQGDLASEQERIRTLQVELDAARVQLQSAPTATTTADPELEQSYKTKVRDLKKQLRTAQNAADERCEKLKIKLSATVKTHKLEISDLKRTLGQEQAELKAKSAALNKAEESAASRGQAYDALKLRYDALQAECDELQKETDTLRKPAPFDTTTMEALRTKNATHIKKNRALTDQNRGLEAKVRDLEDKVQTLRRANQQLEGSQRLGLRTQQV